MKRFKLLLSIVALAIASSASAQFANSTKSTNTTQPATANSTATTTTTVDNFSTWSTYNVSLDSPTIAWDDDDEVLKFDKGFSLGYTTARELDASMPLFLEYGAELSYAYYRESERDSYYDYDYDAKLNFMNLVVPVTATYLYSVSDNLILAPYVGVYGRYGLSFNETQRWGYNGESEEESCSLYDSDYDFNRFTYGTVYGVNVHISNKYIVGLKWQSDVSALYEEEGDKMLYKNGASISVAMKF